MGVRDGESVLGKLHQREVAFVLGSQGDLQVKSGRLPLLVKME